MTTLRPEQIAKRLIEETGGQWEFDPDDEAQVRAIARNAPRLRLGRNPPGGGGAVAASAPRILWRFWTIAHAAVAFGCVPCPIKGFEPHGFSSNPGGFVHQVSYGLKQFVALLNQGLDVAS